MNRHAPTVRFAPPRLMDTVLAIEESLEHPWSVREMACRAGLSPSRFHQVFLEGVGESPMQYLVRLRLERAAVHLVYSDWTVTEIGIVAGFGSHSGFTHAFCARYGIPPAAFRHRAEARSRFLQGYHGRTARNGAEPSPSPLPMPKDLKVSPCPGFRIAFLRQWGFETGIPAAWGRLATWAARRGIDASGFTLAGCHYDDLRFTSRHHWRYDAGLLVGTDFDPRGEVSVRDVPAGLVATLPYEGPPGGLAAAWARFAGDWLPRSGFQPRTLFACDLIPGSLLAPADGDPAPPRPSRVRCSLCIPLASQEAGPVPGWAAGPIDSATAGDPFPDDPLRGDA